LPLTAPTVRGSCGLVVDPHIRPQSEGGGCPGRLRCTGTTKSGTQTHGHASAPSKDMVVHGCNLLSGSDEAIRVWGSR
jgi:hypothetical protein